jgi:hypothetical protein
MAGWQSSNLVVRDPSRPGMEACVECKSFNETQLQDAMGALQRGEQGADERVEAIQRQSASVVHPSCMPGC